MIKFIQLFSFVAFAFVLTSFTDTPTYNFIGTYGVSENNPNAIELTLNEDNTFTYKDFSNTKKRIDVTGNWMVKNNVITLSNHSSKFSFHDKWTIKMNGQVAKSRKGLTFYTLMKL